MSGQPWQASDDGLLLSLRVTARASRSAIKGIIAPADGRPVLAVALAAPPVDGAANQALIELIAKTFGVSRSAVSLRTGATARTKRVHVAGDPAALLARAETIVQPV